MGDTRLSHLGTLLESKNRAVRRETALAFARYSLCDANVQEVLIKYLSSFSWDCRVSAADAVHAVVSRIQFTSGSRKIESPYNQLRDLDLNVVIRTYKPLLSVDSTTIASTSKTLNSKQQRQIIDDHLNLQSATGITSAGFLADNEVLPSGMGNNSPSAETGEELQIVIDHIKKEEEVPLSDEESVLFQFVKRLIVMLADQRWYVRHGVAIAISRIISSAYDRIPCWLVDNSSLRLLQVLVLDQFNDFVSGRSATAPVRETCAQALGHLLFKADRERRNCVLQHVQNMLSAKGDKMWHCRQSALLVLKYFFAVAESCEIFNICFTLVLQSLSDDVDEVVSCSVSALSSFLSNESLGDSKTIYIEEVMQSIWRLLKLEAAKEQIKSGLDALAIDLMTIIETWMRVDTKSQFTRDMFLIIISMIDSAYKPRTFKIVTLLSLAFDRGTDVLSYEDIVNLLKTFYRVLLFSAPSEDLVMLELVYLTTLKVVQRYKDTLFSQENAFSDVSVGKNIGLWTSCLMYDHRNPLIDVFAMNVDGSGSKKEEPNERMCSEEMRFLTDRDKDGVYITRKILAAKFLAYLIHLLYKSGTEYNGQLLSQSIQSLLVPALVSNSLYQCLGTSIIVNEWAALYKADLNSGVAVEPPMLIISHSDSFLRTGNKNFVELSATVTQLTQDCNEFVDYCCQRGVKRDDLNMEENASVEDISRMAFQVCQTAGKKTPKQLEALESRYKLLCEWIDFTKVAVKSNSARVNAFLSSALFYFGSAPEKLTPMVRPLVECMQVEENDTVAAEVFKGAVPLMVVFSWPRNPKPYVKVLAKALEYFAACDVRIPKPEQWLENKNSIISIIDFENPRKIAVFSRNAELMLIICSTFTVDQMPEYFEYFNLDDCPDDQLLSRLELHLCLWSRVGSRLSDNSATRIITLLKNENPAYRYGAAKAVATFCSSSMGDTLSKVLEPIKTMSENMDSLYERMGAIEALLRVSSLGNIISPIASLLAPIVFQRLSDKSPEIRTAAGTAFRNIVPLLALQAPTTVPNLSTTLQENLLANADFINVLSCPSNLPLIKTCDVKDLRDDIQLRHYQQEGITWMRFLRRYGLNGILADDMGLGKTLQTMCAIVLSNEYDNCKSKTSLILCPRTLVDHWCCEWRRFFPNRKPAKKFFNQPQWKNSEVVVMAYEDLKCNHGAVNFTWNYIVMDEGHIMRNSKTSMWQRACELKATSRLILSGTPVQNSPGDLWSLFTWLMPGYLGEEKMFRAQFLRKVMKCRSAKATEKDIKEGSEAVDRLHKLILPFVLRRMKSEVLKELPDKNVQDYECELTSGQKAIYNFVIDRCSANRANTKDSISPLHALITLRKVVDHPRLVTDVLERVNAPKEIIDMAMNASSGKMAALGQLLNECRIGKCEESSEDNEEEDILNTASLEIPHRALIFCQWQSSVGLVSNALKSCEFGTPISHLILDGSIPASDRQSVVDRFNNDHTIDVLVLTTHIGGIGLNLIGADVVIFLDHDWNPMKDLQAIDRAHRIGQTRKVNVYRLITLGTIEEKVMSLHKFKMNTADALIGADNRSLQSMATEELLNMFTLEEGSNTPKQADGVPAKRAKKLKEAMTDEEKWNLADLWDESQYEEQFDVKNFVSRVNPKPL